MFLLTLLAVASLSSGVLSNSVFSKCKVSDNSCIEKSVNAAIPILLSGIPELGVETSDPIYIEKIEGNLSILKYVFYNSTIIGYKNCHVKNLKINDQISTLHYDLHCPPLKMSGDYEIDGRLIILPVQGKGAYSIITGNYVIKVDCELKKVEGSDGKTHLVIKNFKLACQALSPNKYDFKNLFNGQKDLSDVIHNFANNLSWKEVAELVQDPTWYAALKKIIGNINQYLKIVPLDELKEN